MSVGAGGVDWLVRWREMHEAAEAASVLGQRGGDADRWRDRAHRFDRMSRDRIDPALGLLEASVLGTDVVLDVGAGTGRHAVPLARRCAQILAIEPSSAMRARLELRIAEERLANVTVVAQPWPCSVPVGDVAYSSHVLYGVADVAPFLEEMSRAARRTCVLILGLRAPSDSLAPLAEAVHGKKRPPRPAALEALAVLHQLGHPASLRIVPGSERTLAFAATADDLDELCHRVGVPADEQGRTIVCAALDRMHPRSLDGGWSLGASGSSALLEWPGGAG